MGSLLNSFIMEGAQQIKVHPLTHDPNKAWNEINKRTWTELIASWFRCSHLVATQQRPQIIKCDTSALRKINSKGNPVRVVCISDTHNRHSEMEEIPQGDILIHAGDLPRTCQNYYKFLKLKISMNG